MEYFVIIVSYVGRFFGWLFEVIRHPIFITAVTYFILDTIKSYKKVIGEIDSTLLFYQNILCTPIDNEEKNSKCRESLRKLAGDLGAVYNAIPVTRVFSLIRLAPHRKDIQDPVRDLGFLSNNVGRKSDGDGANDETIKKIRRNLRIPNLWSRS